MKKAEEANAYYNKQPEKMHVYDAGESVQNMPVKKTEESHKKCTPGEFGMNKEGQANLLRAITKLAAGEAPSSTGADTASYLGGLGGGYGAPVAGGAALGAVGGGLMGAMNPGEEEEYDDRGNVIGKKRKSRLGAAMGGAMAGGAAGGALGAGAKYFGLLGNGAKMPVDSLPPGVAAQRDAAKRAPATNPQEFGNRVKYDMTGNTTRDELAKYPENMGMSYNDAAKAMDANPFTPVQ